MVGRNVTEQDACGNAGVGRNQRGAVIHDVAADHVARGGRNDDRPAGAGGYGG